MRYWMSVIAAFLCFPVFGQVKFLFVPELYGRSIDGLYNCRLINPSGKRTGTLSITVTERKAGTVFTITTNAFDIPPGTSVLPASAVRNARLQFFSTRISAITRQQRYFPQGLYEYCFTLNMNGATEPLAEDCFEYELTPFAELNLISPYDKDKVCELRPLFTWQPLIPAIVGSSYQMVLVAIKEGQSGVEALNYNLPIVNQSSIIANMLPYPPVARELEKGKRYAWQVTAYKDRTVLNRSEIWEFTAGCEEEKARVITEDGYRDIEDLVKGNFYVANGYVRFSLMNAYQPQKLKYEITALDEANKKIKGMPKIQLDAGKNKVTIELSGIGGFTEGNFYVLSAWLPDGSVKKLRFVYYEAK